MLVTDIVSLELTFRQLAKAPIIKHLEDVIIDADANCLLYHFNEEETMSLVPKKPLSWQLRMLTSGDSIVGTVEHQIDIKDLISNQTLP